MEEQLSFKHTNNDLLEIEQLCERFFSENNAYDAQFGILMTLILQTFEALNPEKGEELSLTIHSDFEQIRLNWMLKPQSFQNLRDWIHLQETSLIRCLWNSYEILDDDGIISFFIQNIGVQQAVYAKRKQQLRNYFMTKAFTPSL
ncbi:MAG: hypothetical protein H3C41_08110 [Bacteroidales bacterium]|nr:hypothetical protein [Bacteroidales bacterium]